MDSISLSLGRRADQQLNALRPLRQLRDSVVRPADGDNELILNSAAFGSLADALANITRNGISDDPEQRQETLDELERYREWALRCAHSFSRQNLLAHRIEKGGRKTRLN
eukprot:9049109-Pyramimonas_sp.AAC.1